MEAGMAGFPEGWQGLSTAGDADAADLSEAGPAGLGAL